MDSLPMLLMSGFTYFIMLNVADAVAKIDV